MESGYYPPGAEFDPTAPYNQEYLPEKEIDVTVSITLSKTIRINVDDYKIKEDADENGKYSFCDFSECDLYKAVEEQVTLPHNLALFTERMFNYDLALKEAGMPRALESSINDCKYWNVDEFEVIRD